MKKIDLRILKKGDSVVNAFNFGENVGLLVKQKSNNFNVVLISPNAESIPEVSAIWTISEGDNEIVVERDGVKISTF
jgi:hypothetical protein